MRQEYNAENRVIRISYWLGGAAYTLADGYHSIGTTYGADGFAAVTAYYGTEGEPVLNTKVKYHRIDRTYLDRNHYTSEAWFDTEGNPITIGDTYVRIEREFDEKGNAIREVTCGVDGQPIARNA